MVQELKFQVYRRIFNLRYLANFMQSPEVEVEDGQVLAVLVLFVLREVELSMPKEGVFWEVKKYSMLVVGRCYVRRKEE